jgi:hypothetical protein
MPENKSTLPDHQIFKDERDLRIVSTATFVYAIGVCLWTALLVGIFTFGALSSTGFDAAAWPWLIVWALVYGVSGGLLALANFNSARAITDRRDAHLSFFVAGINMLMFPFGTLLSIYSWMVLSRLSVQRLYADPLVRPALPPSAEKNDKKSGAMKKSGSIKLVESSEPEQEPMPFHEAINYADSVEEAMWKKLEEEHRLKQAEAKDEGERPASTDQ